MNVKGQIQRLITKIGFEQANTTKSPIDLGFIKDISEIEIFETTAIYRSAIGTLIYTVNTTRPDIAAGVGILARKFDAPTRKDLNATERIIRYSKGIIDWRLKLGGNSKK